MKSRIVKEECNTFDNTYEIEARFTNYNDFKKARDFICELNREKEEPTPPKCVSAETTPLKKPQGIIIALKDDSILDIARKVVDMIDYSIKTPKGLGMMNFDMKREKMNRIKELIGYLKVYTEWRD